MHRQEPAWKVQYIKNQVHFTSGMEDWRIQRESRLYCDFMKLFKKKRNNHGQQYVHKSDTNI